MESTSRTESGLIVAARGGDREALGALLAAEQALLRRVAASFGGGAARARLDDVVQEASLEAVRSIETLRDEGRFRSWLIGIAIRVARRWRRTLARDRHVELPEDASASVPAREEDPARATARAIDGRRPRAVADCPPELLATLVERAVDELPEGWREVFVLRHGAELRYREIAEALALSEAAVEARLLRARRRVREIVELRLERGEVRAANATEGEVSDR